MAENSPSWTRYLPVILAAAIAIVGIVMAGINFSAVSDDSWDDLISEVEKLQAAAAQAEEIAVKDEQYVECVANKAVHALVVSSVDGLKAARDGQCKIPDADVDVTVCLQWADQVAEGTDIPAAAELAVGAVLPLVPAVVSSTDAPAEAKAWVDAVTSWLDSARPTVFDLVEDPSSGKFHVEGAVIEGCETR